jgi:hypothetical protein
MGGFDYTEIFYVDIFATKGIEYLLVIGYLILLVVFWNILNKTGKDKRGRQEEGKKP